jgi:branched-chain amino acid transport system substrate-binding protein
MNKFKLLALSLACASSLTCLQAQAQQAVKIGFVATMSGPAASLGQDMYDGFMLGLEHSGGKLGGANVELLKEDDQLKPELGVQIINKFLERDKVDIVTGVTFSNVMMAMAKPLADGKAVFVGSNAGPAPLAGAQCNANFFFTSWQNDMQSEAVGKYATDKGYKNVFFMAPNYQAGKDSVSGFKRYYKGNISGELYTTVNQPDYAAEIAQMQAAKPDALYVFYPGGMGVNFIKQMRQAGLLGQIPVLSASTTDGSTLPALKETALGVISGTFWGPDFNNPASKKFVADFEKKYSRIPSQYAAQAYDSALLIDSALKKTGGKAADKAALTNALRAADFKSVRGNFRFNKNGFPIQDMHVFEVAKDSADRVSLKTVSTPLKNLSDPYVTDCPLK